MIHGIGDITRIATSDKTATTLRPRMSDQARATIVAPKPMATLNSTNGPAPSQNFQKPRSGMPQRSKFSEDAEDDAASNSATRSERTALAAPTRPTTVPATHSRPLVDFLLSDWVLVTRAVCHDGRASSSWSARLAQTTPSTRPFRSAAVSRCRGARCRPTRSGEGQPMTTSQHLLGQLLLRWLTVIGVPVQHVPAYHPRDADLGVG
jgi:hypothetical protein